MFSFSFCIWDTWHPFLPGPNHGTLSLNSSSTSFTFELCLSPILNFLLPKLLNHPSPTSSFFSFSFPILSPSFSSCHLLLFHNLSSSFILLLPLDLSPLLIDKSQSVHCPPYDEMVLGVTVLLTGARVD